MNELMIPRLGGLFVILVWIILAVCSFMCVPFAIRIITTSSEKRTVKNILCLVFSFAAFIFSLYLSSLLVIDNNEAIEAIEVVGRPFEALQLENILWLIFVVVVGCLASFIAICLVYSMLLKKECEIDMNLVCYVFMLYAIFFNSWARKLGFSKPR